MARGTSGRIVLEIDPTLKRELHARLAVEGRTLKEWFLRQAKHYLGQYEPIQLAPLGRRAENNGMYASPPRDRRNNATRKKRASRG